MQPERRAERELMGAAVELASILDPRAPGWEKAAQMCLANDKVRDVLLAQIIRDGSFDQAVGAISVLERDPKLNRDAVLAACMWLGGEPEQASIVAGFAKGNKLAGYIELLIMVGTDPEVWGSRLVDSLTEVRPDPATIGPALKPR